MGYMLLGGHTSLYAMHEATAAYVTGSFLGCILLAQCCVEHTLAGAFSLSGRDEMVTASYRKMLTEAEALGWLSEDEAVLFDNLRDGRNPYAHPRPFADPANLGRRVMDTETDPEELLAADAKASILALIRLLNRPPFGLYG